MSNFIESLKHKPKEVRDRYAFLTAFVITGIIAGVWATSLPARFSPQTNIQAQEHVGPGLFEQSLSTMQEDVIHMFSLFGVFRTNLQYSKEDPANGSAGATTSLKRIDLDAFVTTPQATSSANMDSNDFGASTTQ